MSQGNFCCVGVDVRGGEYIGKVCWVWCGLLGHVGVWCWQRGLRVGCRMAWEAQREMFGMGRVL